VAQANYEVDQDQCRSLGVSTMLIGLDSYSFRYAAGLWGTAIGPPLSPEAYLHRAEGLGLAGVQFCDLGHFPSPREPYLSSVRAQAEGAGLYVELGTGGTDPGHLGDALRVATALGATVLRTFVGPFRWEPGSDPPGLVSTATRNLQQALPLAGQLGVRIAIENHIDLLAEELLSLLEGVGSEYLGVCLDTGNPFGLLEDPLAVAEALGPYTLTTHLKEFRVSPRGDRLVLRGAALGEGDVPNEQIVDILRRRSPLGEALHLNIETAIERVMIPVSPEELSAAQGRLHLGQPWAEDQLALPEERGATPAEILAAEHAQVVASAHWALARWGEGH